MKKIPLLLAFIFALTAIVSAQSTFATYDEAMAAGKTAFEAKKYAESVNAYKAATALAKTDPDRAKAILASAGSLLKAPRTITEGAGKFAQSKTVEGNPDAAREAYQAAAALPAAPADLKIKAHFGAAGVYATQLSAGGLQRAELDKILAIPAATPEDKFNAYYQKGTSSYPFGTRGHLKQREDLILAAAVAGISDEKKADAFKVLAESHSNNTEALTALKFYDDIIKLKAATSNQKLNAHVKMANYYGAQGDFTQVRAIAYAMSLLPGIKPEQKADALQMAAQSYFMQNDLPKGEAEIAKIAAIKDIEPKNLPAIQQENGDLLARYGSHTKARAEYDKALKGVTDPKSYIVGDLNNKIIRTWLDEKNYKKLHEAVKKTLAIAEIDAYRKQLASMMDAEGYLAEKKFADAAGIYQAILADTKLGVFRTMKSSFGMARAQYGLKNMPEAKKNYAACLALIDKHEKMFDPRQMKMTPAEIGEFKKFSKEYSDEAKAKIAEIDAKP